MLALGEIVWAGWMELGGRCSESGGGVKQQRIERIDHEIHRVLAEAIATQLKDPRLGFVTVVRVEITPDLKSAKVFVSIIGDRHVARQTMDALHSAAKFLRGELGRAVVLRRTPELTFVEDRTTERAIALTRRTTAFREVRMIQSETRPATTDDVVAVLRARPAFVMVSHVKPDGDTLGSGLAPGLAPKAIGKRVEYFQQDPVPRNLRFLADADKVTSVVPADLPADTLWVFCDMSDRIARGRPAGDRAREHARHRSSPRERALRRVELRPRGRVLDGDVRAAVLRAMDARITPEIATRLLTTIMTDTGGFVHSNTSANVLRLSAEMMDSGQTRN